MNSKTIRIILILVAAISLVFTPANIVSARSLQDIQNDINSQQASLGQVNQQLADAQANLSAQQGNLDSAVGQIPTLQAQINELQAKIDYNNLQIQALQSQVKLMELQKEEGKKKQDRTVQSGYVAWRSQNDMGGYLPTDDSTSPMKLDAYHYDVVQSETDNLDALVSKLDKLDNDLDELTKQTGDLQTQTQTLQQQKSQLEAQIASLQNGIDFTNGQVSNLRVQSNQIQQNINQLSAEQKALQDYENSIINQGSNGGTQTVTSGQFNFFGMGRDNYQGHGVGMSQWGAFGAAVNGMIAQDIVRFYYTGVDITTMPRTIGVDGYGQMDINDYVAGLGEVPDKACGSAEQAAARPDKYINQAADAGSWACWPEEAIKAQLIAARSYAIEYTNRVWDHSICTSAACQVYQGGNGKRWAADETLNQVATYGGSVIEALYSSDNSQGYGTADNDTIFSDILGNATAVPYLRARDDSAFAYRSYWGTWTWRTNGYTLNDGANSIINLFGYSAHNGNLSSASQNYAAEIYNNGPIASISFQRDGSLRVKKVFITGTNGAVKQMAGWWFKVIWNSWVDDTQPTGEKDFIYSLTYFTN